jgi:2-methylcitrate dehydratase PrpD
MTPAERIAAFAHQLRFEDLPAEVVRSVSERVLDTVGVCLAGRGFAPARILANLLYQQGGSPEAAPIGGTQRLPVAQAAFLSGTLAHSVEFDDTHLPSIVHPSAFIVPAVLMAGQVRAATGRELITAAAAGYEVLIRTAMAAYDTELGNSVFFERGLHGASICGALGAAVAASRLIGGNQEETMHALSIAASFASGILESNRTGGTIKQVQAGWACHAGVAAAQLARAGITGPATVLEGRFGLFQAMLGVAMDIDGAVGDLGGHWETPGIVFKPYPTNHFTHTVIDAGIRIRERVGRPLTAEDVEVIEVGVASATVRTIGEPHAAKVRPESAYHARFSAPFTLAMALRGGGGLGLALDDFRDDSIVQDVELLALAEKVAVYGDVRADPIFPRHFPSFVRIRFRDGRIMEEAVLSNRGSRERPLTFREIVTKFLTNVEPLLGMEAAQALAATCGDLQDLADVGELATLWAQGSEEIRHGS